MCMEELLKLSLVAHTKKVIFLALLQQSFFEELRDLKEYFIFSDYQFHLLT